MRKRTSSSAYMESDVVRWWIFAWRKSNFSQLISLMATLSNCLLQYLSWSILQVLFRSKSGFFRERLCLNTEDLASLSRLCLCSESNTKGPLNYWGRPQWKHSPKAMLRPLHKCSEHSELQLRWIRSRRMHEEAWHCHKQSELDADTIVSSRDKAAWVAAIEAGQTKYAWM